MENVYVAASIDACVWRGREGERGTEMTQNWTRAALAGPLHSCNRGLRFFAFWSRVSMADEALTPGVERTGAPSGAGAAPSVLEIELESMVRLEEGRDAPARQQARARMQSQAVKVPLPRPRSTQAAAAARAVLHECAW